MNRIKIIVLVLFVSFILLACGNDDEKEGIIGETVNEETGLEETPLSTYPYLEVEKEVYKLGDEIKVNLFNYTDCSKVCLTEYGREPSANHELSYKKITDADHVFIKTERLKTGGEYTLWLIGPEFHQYLYTVDIHIDDDDENDYGITNAEFKCVLPDTSQEGYVEGYNRILVCTNQNKKLTYRLYWCRDGKRLNDYMALKTVESDKNNFTIELHDNLFKPAEANQIEIAVIEGVSTSYYLDIENMLNLEEAKYEFTFNAISDLHIQSRNDSMLFNAHLKKTLNIIYNSNSKGIFAVGDLINFGKEKEYQFLQTIIESVENKNNIALYPAIGNHEYMYFATYEEPLGYFKKYHKLDSHYYSVEIEGYKFIVLGTDTISNYGVMNNEQLNWLEGELDSVDDNNPVFIMLHQPLKDTVDGTLNTKYGQTDYGFMQSNDKLREIFKKHPNAFIFTGHSHHTLDGDLPVLYTNDDATFINCGSNSYLTQYVGSEHQNEIGGAEGLFVEVYDAYVLIRGKEFCYNKWVANCQIKIPRNN